jgi:hypothetical protein
MGLSLFHLLLSHLPCKPCIGLLPARVAPPIVIYKADATKFHALKDIVESNKSVDTKITETDKKSSPKPFRQPDSCRCDFVRTGGLMVHL